MRLPIATVLAAAAIVSCVQATSPPRDIVISYPASGANVGQTIVLGVGRLNGTYDGFAREVNISLVRPNGSTELLIYSSAWSTLTRSACRTNNGGFTESVSPVTDKAGTYMAVWAVGYWTSANPSKANATYCEPGPFSLQTWVLNATFDVYDMGSHVGGSMETRTTELPMKPTGSAKKVSAAVGQSTQAGWVVSLGLMSMAVLIIFL